MTNEEGQSDIVFGERDAQAYNAIAEDLSQMKKLSILEHLGNIGHQHFYGPNQSSFSSRDPEKHNKKDRSDEFKDFVKELMTRFNKNLCT